MKTVRTTIVLDLEVDDDVDLDEFHDELRDSLESADLEMVLCAPVAGLDSVETVRDIDVEELGDE